MESKLFCCALRKANAQRVDESNNDNSETSMRPITTSVPGKRVLAAAALAVTMVLTPVVTWAADKDAHEDRTELRIKDLHAKLKITSAQEDLWGKVAAAMRDNAKTLDALTQARVEHAKNMTAVDDLKSYGEIADAHADGVKKLTPAFSALYDGMSDAQKKEADALFARGDGQHRRMMSKAK